MATENYKPKETFFKDCGSFMMDDDKGSYFWKKNQLWAPGIIKLGYKVLEEEK